MSTRSLCDMLKSSIIQLLRCAKDMSLDATSIPIFPNDNGTKVEESDSDLEDFFSFCVL